MFKKMKEMKSNEGFSLIELIVVVIILGIIAAIAIPMFGAFEDRAKASAVDAAATNAHSELVAQLVNARTVDTTALTEQYSNENITVEAIQTDFGFCVTAWWTDNNSNEARHETAVGECETTNGSGGDNNGEPGENTTPPIEELTEASGPWQYWISTSTPISGATLMPGDTVTYTLNARNNGGFNSPAINDARVLFTLSDNVTVTNVNASGIENGHTSVNGNIVIWEGMNLDSSFITANTRTITVTITVNQNTTSGVTQAQILPGATEGEFWSGASRQQSIVHNIAGPTISSTINDCQFEPGNQYSEDVCWLDMTGYDPVRAGSAQGQAMIKNLPNGHALHYTVKSTGVGAGNIHSLSVPTFADAYFSNSAPAFNNDANFKGISGKPALHKPATSQTNTVTISNIVLRDQHGNTLTGYSIVGADAENTNPGESIRWTTNTELRAIGQLGNACGGSHSIASPTDYTCVGTTTEVKTGTSIVGSTNPAWFAATLTGDEQAVTFGVINTHN